MIIYFDKCLMIIYQNLLFLFQISFSFKVIIPALIRSNRLYVRQQDPAFILDIGIETHCLLNSKKKIFCSCDISTGATQPNVKICSICTGEAGSLPYLNLEAVGLAIRAGMLLNCTIATAVSFDRKHYSYPDMPKNYQTTQYHFPIGKYGNILLSNGRKIGISCIQLEEDSAKKMHENNFLFDFNRAGIPLLEIVSRPDIHSASEAVKYVKELQQILRSAEIISGSMASGSFRFDVNVSIRPLPLPLPLPVRNSSIHAREVSVNHPSTKDEHALRYRSEIKNINTIQALQGCIEYEYHRQVRLQLHGGLGLEEIPSSDQSSLPYVPFAETRKWDESTRETVPSRTKESSNLYRYIPEPDIPVIAVSRDIISSNQNYIARNFRRLAGQRRDDFIRMGLSSHQIEMLLGDESMMDYLDVAMRLNHNHNHMVSVPDIVKWMSGDMQSVIKQQGITFRDINLTPAYLLSLISLIRNDTITLRVAKSSLSELMLEWTAEPYNYFLKHDKFILHDENVIQKVIREVLDSHGRELEDYRNGKVQLLKYFVGEVLRGTDYRVKIEILTTLMNSAIKEFYRSFDKID